METIPVETIPLLCCSCRHGTMIPASIAEVRRSVFWCRQGVPREPERMSCPCYSRESRGEEGRPMPRP